MWSMPGSCSHPCILEIIWITLGCICGFPISWGMVAIYFFCTPPASHWITWAHFAIPVFPPIGFLWLPETHFIDNKTINVSCLTCGFRHHQHNENTQLFYLPSGVAPVNTACCILSRCWLAFLPADINYKHVCTTFDRHQVLYRF